MFGSVLGYMINQCIGAELVLDGGSQLCMALWYGTGQIRSGGVKRGVGKRRVR